MKHSISIRNNGFVLIELLVVIAVVGILFYTVVTALNPAKNFAHARNTQRESDVLSIINAIDYNRSGNAGVFECSIALPSVATEIGSSPGQLDICSCLVPEHLGAFPSDPILDTAIASCSSYETSYTVVQETDNRITVAAPEAELGRIIQITR